MLHHDSSRSHISKDSIAFLEKMQKLNTSKQQEWMPKSPNVVPMDYAIWGHLKQWLNKMKIETLNELKRSY